MPSASAFVWRETPVATFLAVTSLLAAALPRNVASAVCAQLIAATATADARVVAMAVARSDRYSFLFLCKRVLMVHCPRVYLCSRVIRRCRAPTRGTNHQLCAQRMTRVPYATGLLDGARQFFERLAAEF